MKHIIHVMRIIARTQQKIIYQIQRANVHLRHPNQHRQKNSISDRGEEDV